jgi:hypothetical protein
VIDGETTARTAARAGETLTVEALAAIVQDVDLLAAHPGETVGEGTETDSIENAGGDLLALQTRIAEDADTAAIDTAKTVIVIVIVMVMVNGHQEGTVAHDDDLAPPNDLQVHGHWNDAVHFLRNRMRFQTR